jgi:hypothetical protein
MKIIKANRISNYPSVLNGSTITRYIIYYVPELKITFGLENFNIFISREDFFIDEGKKLLNKTYEKNIFNDEIVIKNVKEINVEENFIKELIEYLEKHNEIEDKIKEMFKLLD